MMPFCSPFAMWKLEWEWTVLPHSYFLVCVFWSKFQRGLNMLVTKGYCCKVRKEWFCSIKRFTNCKHASHSPIPIPIYQSTMHAPISFAQWTGISLVSVPSLATFLDIPKMFSTHKTSLGCYHSAWHGGLLWQSVYIYNVPHQITEILLFKM